MIQVNHQLGHIVFRLPFVAAVVLLTWVALTPGDASAQWVRQDPPVRPAPPVLGDLPAFQAAAIETVVARGWSDNSGDLPGISSGKSMLILAGVVTLGAVAYFALRSDNQGEGETESNEGNRVSRASLLLDLEEPTLTTTLRWRMGVTWAF